MNLWVILTIVILWIAGGLAVAGFVFAFWQGYWPHIAKEQYKADRMATWVLAAFGPPCILGCLLYGWSHDLSVFKYGWRLK